MTVFKAFSRVSADSVWAWSEAKYYQNHRFIMYYVEWNGYIAGVLSVLLLSLYIYYIVKLWFLFTSPVVTGVLET